MRYRCEARTLAGFFQQLAVAYVTRGYFRYVVGSIPERKDPRAVDQRLINKFDVVGKRARFDRKAEGLANVVYLRYQRFFVLMVSEYGHHDVFESEGKLIRDIRIVPIKFAGHSIAHRRGRVHVRIQQELYISIRTFFMDIAVKRSKEWLEEALNKLQFQAFAPVRSQLLCILRRVNARRKVAGLDLVPVECLNLYRQYPKQPLVAVHSMPLPPPAHHRDQLQKALLLPRQMISPTAANGLPSIVPTKSIPTFSRGSLNEVDEYASIESDVCLYRGIAQPLATFSES